MLTAYITSINGEYQGFYADFPTTAEKMAENMKRNLVSPDNYRIAAIESEGKRLVNTMPEPEVFSLDDLQYIGKKLAGMEPWQRDIVHAMLEQAFGDDDKHSIIDAIENVDCCALDKSIRSATEYGKAEIKARLETCGDVYERLSASSLSEETNFAALVDLLHEHVDADALGKEIMAQNDHYTSSLGLLSVDWRDFVCREDLSVPEGYRLNLEAAVKPSLLAQLDTNKTTVQQQAPTVPGDNPKKYDPTR